MVRSEGIIRVTCHIIGGKHCPAWVEIPHTIIFFRRLRPGRISCLDHQKPQHDPLYSLRHHNIVFNVRLDFRLKLADCGLDEQFFYILSRLADPTPRNEGMLDDFDVDLPEKMRQFLTLPIEQKEFSCAQA